MLQQSATREQVLTSRNLFYLNPIVTEDRILSICFTLIISSAHQVGVLYTDLTQSIQWHDDFLGIAPNLKLNLLELGVKVLLHRNLTVLEAFHRLTASLDI